MRAREIISELKLDIPDQMVNVQVPLAAIASSADDEAPIINPGRVAGKDGKYKWSPPLQQGLDVQKAEIGISNDETDEVSAEMEVEKSEQSDLEALKATLIKILSAISR